MTRVSFQRRNLGSDMLYYTYEESSSSSDPLPFPLSDDSSIHRYQPNDNISSDSNSDLAYTPRGMKHEEIVVGVLIGVITFLSVVLLCLTIPPLIRWIRSKFPVSQKTIDRRYETIERWMITKRVRRHDDACERCRMQSIAVSCCRSPSAVLQACPSYDDTVETSPVSETSSYRGGGVGGDNDDDEHDIEEQSASASTCHECAICLEAFVPDEIVSWSANRSCSHVFHHDCIKFWLLSHTDCPFCRKTILSVDAAADLANNNNSSGGASSLLSSFWSSGLSTKHGLHRFIQEWRRRVWSTYFCIEHGLVELPIPATTTTTDTPAAANNGSKNSKRNAEFDESVFTIERKRIMAPRVKREDLVPLRGGRRAEMTATQQQVLSDTMEQESKAFDDVVDDANGDDTP